MPKTKKKKSASSADAPKRRKTQKKELQAKKPLKKEKFFEAIGRRKTAVARVRLIKGDKGISINDKLLEKYFPTQELQQIVVAPLKKLNCFDDFKVIARIKGGGVHAQAEALRHGIARALLLFDQNFRKPLKGAGFLTRDARMRERKKFGLKRARRAPQWRKR